MVMVVTMNHPCIRRDFLVVISSLAKHNWLRCVGSVFPQVGGTSVKLRNIGVVFLARKTHPIFFGILKVLPGLSQTAYLDI
jgi:hypothetical protein